MKAVLLICLIVICIAGASLADYSPINAGSTIIGGSAYMSIESTDGSSLTTISLMPTFGFFASRGFMLGGTVALISMSSEGRSATVFGFGPEARYYFNANNVDPEIKGSMYPFMGGFFSILGESGSDNDIKQFGAILGFNQMMSEHLSTEFQF